MIDYGRQHRPSSVGATPFMHHNLDFVVAGTQQAIEADHNDIATRQLDGGTSYFIPPSQSIKAFVTSTFDAPSVPYPLPQKVKFDTWASQIY